MEFKTELRDATVVTFAGGGLMETTTARFAAMQDGRCFVITDRSPFHPLSLSWPDQPGDRGWLTTVDGHRVVVLDSHEGLLNCITGDLFTGENGLIQRRLDPELCSVVVHVLDEDLGEKLGQSVTLEVDQAFRTALSLQHTGVHLGALALNQCAATFWTKDYTDVDSLGFPNFDKAAVTKSAIGPDVSTDVYRIGKSLRKKGFDRDAFLADLPARSLTINECLRHMLETPAPVAVAPPEGDLDARRIWSTSLNGAKVLIHCGGTHISDLSQIAEITVAIAQSEDGFVTVTTTHAG